ncbi:hypothetical protein [Xanthomonas sp. MUS 060]|uniref:hypothetical protein n=1 Tax=Xanthomonas sp. MUS 060 TaxID=1588031 RepID=UPI00126A775B|nr:hypothetical protein [Xanthomonas sp. MUS 060]
MLEATRRFGFESLAQPHAMVLPRLFGSIAANEQTGTALYQRYAPIAEEAPYPLSGQRTGFPVVVELLPEMAAREVPATAL